MPYKRCGYPQSAYYYTCLHFQAFVTDVFQMCLVMTPLVVGLASSNIVISSALTRTVSELDTGKL